MEAWIVEFDRAITRDVQQFVRSQVVGWNLDKNREIEIIVQDVVDDVVSFVADGTLNHIPGLEIHGIHYWLTNALPIEPYEIDDLRERYRALQGGTILAQILDRGGSGRREVQDDPQT